MPPAPVAPFFPTALHAVTRDTLRLGVRTLVRSLGIAVSVDTGAIVGDTLHLTVTCTVPDVGGAAAVETELLDIAQQAATWIGLTTQVALVGTIPRLGTAAFRVTMTVPARSPA